nr:hypothetical protein [Treponema sp.]
MKKTKQFLLLTGMTFALLFGITACSDDNGDDESPSSGPETTAYEYSKEDRENAAFNLLRGLCNLPTLATNSDEDEGNGVEDLPENWETATYSLDSSLVADQANEKTYFYASSGVADAKEFVSSLLGGEEISDQSQFTTELGSLKFSVAENASNSDAKLYATLELNISLLPELETIKFVPSAEVPYAENKFKGTPYYQIGDIIMRQKDRSYWMCVRPSGGPAYKDYSYWICL